MKFISITPENISEYETIVETQKTPALVKLYSPNCGHCQMMQSAWDALKNNAGIKNLDIAVIEVRNDALESISHETTKNFQGFPTIRVVINGKIKKEYEGDRSTNDMVNFIKENIGNNRQKGGKSKKRKFTKRSKSKRSKRSKRSKSKRSKRRPIK